MIKTLVALLAASVTSPAVASPQDSAPEPRLVVVLTVDSLIPEQLERLRPWWRGGFKRLLEQGAVFDAAQLPHAFTDSAAGVASFATGRLPRAHGIVKDVFYDRAQRKQRGCVNDPGATTVSSSDWLVSERGSASSSALLVPGWAEHLRAAWPASRSVAISGKGATAALIAGQHPSLAIWWDSYGRGFVSSDRIVERLPQWLASWNADWPTRARDWSWTSSLPASPERMQTAADERVGEGLIGGVSARLPFPAPDLPEQLEPAHRAHLAGRAYFSPLIDELTAEVALRAVVGEQLGLDESVDLLAVGFSASELLVQTTGPYSVEVTDTLLRLDRELGELFAGLDEQVGEGHWLAVLASDRGVLELPEGSPGSEEGGVRLRVRERRRALQVIRGGLREQFEQDFGADLSLAGDEVMLPRMNDEDDTGALGQRARALVCQLLLELEWVAAVHSREELLAEPSAEDSKWLRLARASYHPERGADVVVRRAHRHLLGVQTGTAGGSPYLYDRRQTLLFMGHGFAPGVSSAPASGMDALPSVLGALGLDVPAELEGSDLFRR